jgi:ribosomal protein S18 acetylase RimI-like enzyme
VADDIEIEKVEQVTDELVEAWQRLMPQLSSSADSPSEEWLATVLASDSEMFVARHPEDGIVGSLTLVLTCIPVGLKAWIEDVVVDENFRGKGIGEALTRAGIEWAQAAGARNINLTSRPDRQAGNRLYEKLGFELKNTNYYRYKG